MAKLVDAQDLGSCPFKGWGFESPLPHQPPAPVTVGTATVGNPVPSKGTFATPGVTGPYSGGSPPQELVVNEKARVVRGRRRLASLVGIALACALLGVVLVPGLREGESAQPDGRAREARLAAGPVTVPAGHTGEPPTGDGGPVPIESRKPVSTTAALEEEAGVTTTGPRAFLDVRAIFEGGEPVGYHEITVRPEHPEQAPASALTRTMLDPDGRRRVRVLPGVRYRVVAHESHRTQGKRQAEVGPLQEGEVRAVVLVLERARLLAGCLVDDETGRPIAEADVAVSSKGGRSWTHKGVCASGRFEMYLGPRQPDETLEIRAEGYVPLQLRPEAIDSSTCLRLRRGATLHVLVTREGRPYEGVFFGDERVEGSRILVRSQPPHAGAPGPTWAEETDEHGQATFTGLPMGEPLEVAARRAQGGGLVRGTTVLASPEGTYELELQLGTKLTVLVREEPVRVAKTAWIVPAAWKDAHHGARHTWMQVAHRPFRRAVMDLSFWSHERTSAPVDQDGRCTFRPVEPGRYLMGFEPAHFLAHAERYIDVPPGVDEVTLEVRLGTGLLRGVVVDERSRPFTQGVVYVRRREPEREWKINVSHEGEFLHRVPPDEDVLVWFEDGERSTSPVLARAGDDLELVVPQAASVRGIVVPPLPASVVLRPEHAPSMRGVETFCAQDGSFAFPSVAPGTYRLLATTHDGQAARAPVRVSVGAAAEVRLELAPGARLELELTRTTTLGSYELLSEGARCATGALVPGTPVVIQAPPGEAALRIEHPDEDVGGERLFHLAPGEEKYLVLGD